MPNQHTEWPEADIEKLKQLVKEGLSTRLIGREMGRTKGSIIGKIHRLKIAAHDYPRKCVQRNRKADGPEQLAAWGRSAARRWGPAGPRPLQVKKERVEKVATLLVQQAVSAPLSKALLIDAITERTCKWMDGDPRLGGTFCGHETLPGAPYCGYHYGRAHYAGSQADFDAAIEKVMGRQPKDRILMQEAA
jgi:hypothetical protein